MSKYYTKRITSIGGSALIEGIMMRGPKRTTVAVRTGEEEIYTEDLTFKSLDMLYELAGYDVDTYELVNNKEYRIEKAVDGDIIEADLALFTTRPDKITVLCDNPCYTARIDSTGITSKIQIKNKNMMK